MSTLTSREFDNRLSHYPNDGLIDLFIGFGILFAGLFLWTEMVWLAAIFIPVFLPSFQTARKRFLEARGGALPRDPQNQKIMFSVILLLGLLFLTGIGVFFAFNNLSGPANHWIRQYFLLLIGVVFASVWLMAALMVKINRFYLYALFTFAALAVAQFTAVPFWISLVFLGGLIGFVGLLLLVRFIKEHPIVG